MAEAQKNTNHEVGRVILPPVDIYETEEGYVVHADMPAVDREHIEVTLDNGELLISGTIDDGERNRDDLKYSEYRLNNYQRRFRVGNDIDGERISAGLEDGVLTIHLPKKEEVKPRKIEISVH
jgi:HSP20 family protein